MTKRAALILLVSGLLAIMLTIAVSYRLFFAHVTFIEPWFVQVENSINNTSDSIECIAITPNGRKVNIPFNKQESSFCVEGYFHLKEIELIIPANIIQQNTTIVFAYGSDKVPIKIDTGKHTGEKPVYLSEHYFAEHSLFQKIITVFLWKAYMQYFIAGFAVLVFMLLIFGLHRLFTRIESGKHNDFFIKLSISSHRIIGKFAVRLAIALTIAIVYSAILFSTSSFKGVCFKMNDLAYHSAGVNFANGHGISRIGAIDSFEAYNFDDFGYNLEFNYRLFTQYPGLYFYHHPPGYGIFAGLVYTVFGINAIGLKQVQLLLIIITAACMPLLAFRLWKTKGFALGLICSLFFVATYHRTAHDIEPQALLLFLSFIFVWLIEVYLQKKALLMLVLSALVAALLVLTKISLMLLPAFLLIYLVYKAISRDKTITLQHSLVFTAVFFTPVALWWLYANNHRNTDLFKNTDIEKFEYNLLYKPLTVEDSLFLYPIFSQKPECANTDTIIDDGGVVEKLSDYNRMGIALFGETFFSTQRIFIATQTNNMALLLAHNEYIGDGGFSARWLDEPNSFYQNDGMENRGAMLRVLNFYLHHPAMLFKLPMTKMYRAFGVFPFLYVLLLAYCMVFLLNTLQIGVRLIEKYRASGFVIINAFLLFPLVVPFGYTAFCILLILVAALLVASFAGRSKPVHRRIPVGFVLIIISQAALSIAISGNRRFTEITDFALILMGVFVVITINMKYILPKLPKTQVQEGQL